MDCASKSDKLVEESVEAMSVTCVLDSASKSSELGESLVAYRSSICTVDWASKPDKLREDSVVAKSVIWRILEENGLCVEGIDTTVIKDEVL